MTEKCITNVEVVSGLMAYVTMILFGNLRVEMLGLEINEDVSIPGVRRVDEEQRFIR
jgi:hypothetical protein